MQESQIKLGKRIKMRETLVNFVPFNTLQLVNSCLCSIKGIRSHTRLSRLHLPTIKKYKLQCIMRDVMGDEMQFVD